MKKFLMHWTIPFIVLILCIFDTVVMKPERAINTQECKKLGGTPQGWQDRECWKFERVK